MAAKYVVFITGANQGLGYETAKRLVTASPRHHVILGCRDAAKADNAVSQLRAIPDVKSDSVEPLVIDVTNDTSVDAAAAEIRKKHGHLDALVNNAGIFGSDQPSRESLRNTLNTNVVGSVSVTEAFIPLLRKAKSPRLVFIASKIASFAHVSDPQMSHHGTYGFELRMSLAARNMAMTLYANHEKMKGIKVFGADPGFLATNLTGEPDAMRAIGAIEPEEGGKAVADIVMGKRDREAGCVTGIDGRVPW